jgi:hypothetical protein
MTTYIDVAIAEATASTHGKRAAAADGAACAAAEKHKVAKYKEVMRLSPTAQFIPFIMEANGRLGKEAQKLLIALSCAIVRMENKHPEGTDAFRFAAGKEKHFWMRRLSVALQKGNAMTFDAYCEWRNTRDLRVHDQAGFIAKRKQQRRTRQADAFLFRPSVPRFDDLVSVRA